MILGIDTSRWEDNPVTPQTIDWNKVKSAGAEFVIMKATEGASYVDPVFALHKADSKGILYRGSYHYWRVNQDIKAQAANYFRVAGNMDMPPVLDVEDWYKELPKGALLQSKLLAMLAEIDRVFGRECMIYTSPNIIKYYLNLTPSSPLCKRKLWIANYYVSRPDITPFSRWSLWQFSDRGVASKYGIYEAAAVDENFYNGTLEDFKREMLIPETNPQPEKRLYVVKDDLWANDPDRMRVGLPSAVRYRGGKGTVKLNMAWRDYVWRINDPFQRYQFTEYANLKKAVGWCNQGDPDVVEQVTFSGNIVRGYPEGERVYINTIDVSGPIPQVEARPTEQALNNLVHLLTTQYSTYLDMTTNGRNPRTLLMSNPGEKCWMEARYLAPVTLHRATVKVTAFPSLRVRAWPSTSAATMRYILYNGTEYAQYTTQIGTDIWGRVMGGWICLRQGTNYLTTWRP